MNRAQSEHRFRFRIRTALIGITILCTLLGGAIEMTRLKQLRDRYQGLATMHAKVEVMVRSSQRRAETEARDSEYFVSGFESLMKRQLDKCEFEFE
jgi:hypothetical protein